MTVNAVVVRTDGTTETIDLGEPGEQLARMYAAIGCKWVEAITVGPHLTLWVDEEGLYAVDPVVNRHATAIVTWIANQGAGPWINTGPFVGNAIFTGGVDEGGNTLGIRPKAAELIIRFVAAAAKHYEKEQQ